MHRKLIGSHVGSCDIPVVKSPTEGFVAGMCVGICPCTQAYIAAEENATTQKNSTG